MTTTNDPTNLNKTKKPEGGPVGNSKAEKHGGGAALRSLTTGAPLTGLAAAELSRLQDDYQAAGIPPLVELGALRLQTAANLYWDALQKAADNGDLILMDRYVQRFGWLQGVALRALDQLEKVEANRGKAAISASDILQGLKGGDNGSEHD